MSKLDKILDDYYQQRTLDIIKQNGVGWAKVGEETKPADWHSNATKEIKQLFQELIDEVLGENNELPFDDRDWDRVQHSNQLRVLQRQRAKDLMEKL